MWNNSRAKVKAAFVTTVAALMITGGIAGYVYGACDEACTGYDTGCAGNPGDCLGASYRCPEMSALFQKEFDTGYAVCQSATGSSCPEHTAECAQVDHYFTADPQTHECQQFLCTSHKWALDACT